MPAIDHAAEVAALATVVRVTFDDLVALGRPLPPAALAALQLVEAWVAGEPISIAALDAAKDAAHENGVPYAKRTKDSTASWAGSTAGNLAVLAKKERGWQGVPESVLNAAACTLEALRVDGVKRRAALDAIYREALARVPRRAPGKAKPKAKAKARSTSFAKQLGAAANRRLAARRPCFDEAQRGTDDQLRELLLQRGYAVPAAVLAFDARYGGLRAADDASDEAQDWLFGAYACLRSDAHRDPRGDQASWVPVAYSPSDCIFFLDEAGVAWALDTIADTRCTRYADDGDAMMKRIFTED